MLNYCANSLYERVFFFFFYYLNRVISKQDVLNGEKTVLVIRALNVSRSKNAGSDRKIECFNGDISITGGVAQEILRRFSRRKTTYRYVPNFTIFTTRHADFACPGEIFDFRNNETVFTRNKYF